MPIGNDAAVTLDNWQDPPFNRWGFQNVSSLIKSERIPRSTQVTALPYNKSNLSDLQVVGFDEEPISLSALLEKTYTDAFLVMHKGKIITEDYWNGMNENSLHLLMSCTKSYMGSLTGVFIEQGVLALEQDIPHYVPALKNTAFEHCTIRQMLDMACGAKFSEDYGNPKADIFDMEQACRWRSRPTDYQGPDNLLEYAKTLKEKSFEHGEQFAYRSIITDVLGIVIEHATGEKITDLIRKFLWQPLGCENEAEITVDNGGYALVDGGMSISLRDFARFGQMILQKGFYNNKQIIPADWITDCRFGDETCKRNFLNSERGKFIPKGMYRNQWWNHNVDQGILYASGINGQFLYIEPDADVVIAKFSTDPEFVNLWAFTAQRNSFQMIAQALNAAS